MGADLMLCFYSGLQGFKRMSCKAPNRNEDWKGKVSQKGNVWITKRIEMGRKEWEKKEKKL